MKRNKVRRKGRSDGEMPCRTAADAGSGTTDRGGVHHILKKVGINFQKNFFTNKNLVIPLENIK